jgi:hypothetical protein
MRYTFFDHEFNTSQVFIEILRLKKSCFLFESSIKYFRFSIAAKLKTHYLRFIQK